MKNLFSKKNIYIAIGVIVIVIIVATSISSLSHTSNRKKEKSSYPQTIKHSTDDPDEHEITKDNYVWSGKDNEPKRITIPSINAQGYIQKVDVDQRKEVGVPSNINLAGWFMESSIPGQPGLSIIDGHVDGKSKPGIFKSLDRLKTGSTFSIEFGNGKKQNFKVTSTTTVPKDKAPEVLFSQDPTVKSQLNLVTCGGTFDRTARHYNDRIIVTSIPTT